METLENLRWEMDNGKLEMNNGKQTIENRQSKKYFGESTKDIWIWKIENRTMGNRQQEIYNWKLTFGNQQLTFGHWNRDNGK